MKLKKAEGKLYSITLISYVSPSAHEDHGFDAPSVDKQVIANTVSKVLDILETLSIEGNFTLPYREKLRSMVCSEMPQFNYKSYSAEGIDYMITVKQHMVDIGVVIQSKIDEDAEYTECLPF
jgi:hypothetical protein